MTELRTHKKYVFSFATLGLDVHSFEVILEPVLVALDTSLQQPQGVIVYCNCWKITHVLELSLQK